MGLVGDREKYYYPLKQFLFQLPFLTLASVFCVFPIFTVVYLLFETREAQANNCHYQEIPPRNRNHTSHDQFKSPKPSRKLLAQSQSREQKRRGENIQPKRKPTLPGGPTIYSRYGGSSSCHPLLTVLRVCCDVVGGKRQKK